MSDMKLRTCYNCKMDITGAPPEARLHWDRCCNCSVKYLHTYCDGPRCQELYNQKITDAVAKAKDRADKASQIEDCRRMISLLTNSGSLVIAVSENSGVSFQAICEKDGVHRKLFPKVKDRIIDVLENAIYDLLKEIE